jgi:rhodanese-related sulfurtransferase
MQRTTSITTCTVDDLAAALAQGHQVIDVREAGEYETQRIAGTRLAPLSALERHLDGLRREQPVYLVCRSSQRASKAAERLAGLGFSALHVIDGGLLAWVKSGRPVERSARRVWALDRQVRFTAGTLVLLGLALGQWLHPGLALLSAGIGAGLVFSAVTDTCGMGMLLARMPWNRATSCPRPAHGGPARLRAPEEG